MTTVARRFSALKTVFKISMMELLLWVLSSETFEPSGEEQISKLPRTSLPGRSRPPVMQAAPIHHPNRGGFFIVAQFRAARNDFCTYSIAPCAAKANDRCITAHQQASCSSLHFFMFSFLDMKAVKRYTGKYPPQCRALRSRNEGCTCSRNFPAGTCYWSGSRCFPCSSGRAT